MADTKIIQLKTDNGQVFDLYLDAKEVEYAKQLASSFIEQVQDKTIEANTLSFYYTFLIELCTMSGNLLNEVETKILQDFLIKKNQRKILDLE